MKVLALKPGHDGHIVYVDNGVLVFSTESEKDSGNRYAPVDGLSFAEALQCLDAPPDIFALSGWSKGFAPNASPIGAGYVGIDAVEQRRISILGLPVRYFSSSHERSHILCSYALSPYPNGTPCYALLWEGHIGSFYEINDEIRIRKLADIMTCPGIRYAQAYAIADPTFHLPRGGIRLGDAGKLMALAAFETNFVPTLEEKKLLSLLMARPSDPHIFHKDEFRNYAVFNSGVESHHSKRIARLISDGIFQYFIEKNTPLITDRKPLLISGGCGLNCDWNRAWLDTGLFSDVFIPPCTNDTGSAIGTAADAQWHDTGNAKLRWTVYSGPSFIDDIELDKRNEVGKFRRVSNDIRYTARLLRAGAVLAWVSGRAEIGPRALGNRSIIAEPFNRATLERLNHIKRREQYRPIAPICLQEDAHLYFDITQPSPHMLFFSRTKVEWLRAVTHVDGSARVQTVNHTQNPLLYRLLTEFRSEAGVGVLCNTSLNFNGYGFINRASDLVKYADENELDGFSIEGEVFLRDPLHLGDRM